jgi:hypothetical protein
LSLLLLFDFLLLLFVSRTTMVSSRFGGVTDKKEDVYFD